MADTPRQRTPSAKDADGESQPLSGCLARLIWMGAGNMALLLIAVSILHQPAWTFTVRDGCYWLTVVALIVVRLWDVRRLGGLTVDGEPATMAHVRWHAGVLIAASALVWLLAQSFHLSAG